MAKRNNRQKKRQRTESENNCFLFVYGIFGPCKTSQSFIFIVCQKRKQKLIEYIEVCPCLTIMMHKIFEPISI